jgi:hypothetical protein
VIDRTGPVAGRTVQFTVSRGGALLFEYAGASAANGTVVLQLPPGQLLPGGRLDVHAALIGTTGEVQDTDSTQVVIDAATLAVTPTSLSTPTSTAYPTSTPITATLTDARGPIPDAPVTFTLPASGAGATFPGGVTTATVTTDASGVAVAPALTARRTVGTFVATVSADGAVSATVSMVATDTGAVTLSATDPSPSSPLGVTATVTDNVGPVAGRTVTFTVSRGTRQLFTASAVTAADGTAVLQPTAQGLPSGRLTVRADLVGILTPVQDTDTVTTVVIVSAHFSFSPTSLSTRAGRAFPSGTPLVATLTDPFGAVAGVPVTFTLPASGVGATFANGRTTATVTTDANGRATAPQMTARNPVGVFEVTATAEGAVPKSVPMAAQYGWSAFSSPLSAGNTLSRNAPANVPLQISALLADGSKLSDSAAQALVNAGRVQIRWRESSSTGAWSASTGLATYDTKPHAFIAAIKSLDLGMVKGKTYTVMIRILPAPGDPTPPGDTPRDGTFDLGSQFFKLKLT